jgi:DNA-binding transcriptional MocR family regulator
VRATSERGVLVEDAATHWAHPADAPPSLVLGYGELSEPTIQRAITVLAGAIAATSPRA